MRKFEEKDPRARDVREEFENAEKAREIDLQGGGEGNRFAGGGEGK